MADLSGLTTNFFAKASETFTDNLSSSVSAGATTVPVNDASDFSTGDVVVLIVDAGTSNEAVFIGKKDTGNQFIQCVWTEGNLAANHSAGATIADYVSATHFDAMSKGIQQFLNQSGKMLNTAVTEDGRVISYFSPTGLVAPYAGSSAPNGWLLCDGTAVSRSTYADLFSLIGTTYGAGNGSTTFNLPDLRSRVPVGVGAGVFSTTFASTDVNTGTDVITVPTNDSLQTGTAVLLTAGGAAPTGLTSGNTYYVIRVTATTIKLASSLANAVAGTQIDITGAGSGTNTLSLTYTNHSLAAKGGEETHAITITEMPAHTHSVAGESTDTSANGSNAPMFKDLTIDRSMGTGSTGSSGAHNILQPYLALNYIIKT